MQPEILNSWKEISSYLGRGVRTVQRWERDFGLPVRRPAGHLKSSVVALRADIDAWLANRSTRLEEAAPAERKTYLAQYRRLREDLERLQRDIEVLRSQQAQLLVHRDKAQQTKVPKQVEIPTVESMSKSLEQISAEIASVQEAITGANPAA
jgi:chromosome segregation ATPase